MAGNPPPAKLLLVEGADERHLIECLWKRCQYPESFKICDKQGVSRLMDSISLEAKTSGRTALGILMDANSDPTARWQAIGYRLAKVGINVPTSMAPTGTIINGGDDHPRVGIWLMPDNRSQGQVEDFVRELVPRGDSIWPLAESYINGIPEADRKFKPQKILRARIHAWLAAREEPRRIGLAVTSGDLDATALAARKLINWLRQLFA